jgi:hypothetical protein
MKVSKSAIFLFELMVVILVFTVSAAVCASVFAKAHGFSADSKDLTAAVVKAESVAELFKNTGGKETLPGEFLFDKEWNPVSAIEESKFRVVLSPSEQGEMAVCLIEAYRGDELIYDLEVKAYD